ncbi:hypothetical protein EBU71_04345, partial [bacterium]|nr:hypothetical protein [Candidatus Elulimicrobium humile]
MIIRENCIFCEKKLTTTLFESDLTCFSGHYPVDNTESNFEKMPFNITVCANCETPQLKYLGNPFEIYRINHADNTGETMKNLHTINSEFILKYRKEINNIIEVGSSVGTLSDMLLEKLKTDYYIVEPNFFGEAENKIIIEDFYENVEDGKIDA